MAKATKTLKSRKVRRSKPNSKPAWEVHVGDARRVLSRVNDERFSCTITSPPYFWQRDYGVEGQIGLENSVDAYVESIVETMAAVRRVLKKDGLLFLNLGDTYYSGKGRPHGNDPKHSSRRMDRLRLVDASGLGFARKTLLGLPWRIANQMIDEGWALRSSIIWRRSKPLPEANVKDRPWRTYEFVFLFAKSPKYSFDRKALSELKEEDVWTIDSRNVKGRTHPATFPEELVDRCLNLTAIKSGELLDPFAGSGTALRVANKRGLMSFGIDLNDEFCEKAAKDLENL